MKTEARLKAEWEWMISRQIDASDMDKVKTQFYGMS